MVERALARYIPSGKTYPPKIHKAMRYSLFPGGKRFRAILAIAGGETAGGKARSLLPAACAIELIHTYSLIHDDLPAIDNDDYRRGKPSLHRKFGEAAAILTGDALLSRAFGLLTENSKFEEIEDRAVLKVIRKISEAIGTEGMIGGQLMDIEMHGKAVISKKGLNYIHAHKTASLIAVSVEAGAILSGADKKTLGSLASFGRNIGIAFQIADDIRDVQTKSDEPNYARRFGLSAAQAKVEELLECGKRSLAIFGKNAETLTALADSIRQ